MSRFQFVLAGFWIGQEIAKRQQITGLDRPRPVGNSSFIKMFRYFCTQIVVLVDTV